MHYAAPMRHGKLHGIAHNFADSIAGGASFIFGYCFVPIFEEASASEDRSLVVDFLRGTVEGADSESDLAKIIPMFKEGFPEFCAKHEADVQDFKEFIVRYIADHTGISFTVTILDKFGKTTSREYLGNPGKRVKILDEFGRRRRKVVLHHQ
ncbi:hypothetical protein FEE96_03155 [Parasedimentitalea maritima]|uniref:Uncharacterized protein n=1 Tax=Parasedimentitalea maritima TaxID=2578117 RepID=A0ABY2V6F2_9RHOB|nr:hypothetical protein [Zongyanglinia marina]TLP69299.1 hypothetical protein FEE96_03155 [Zongyanglinia marina]